jgi:hypothetical protein
MANNRKFASRITFNSNDFDHGVQLFSDKAVLVLEVAQEILVFWHSFKLKAALLYVNLVNSIAELPFKVLQNYCLEKRIADVASLAKSEGHGKSGRKKQELLKKKRCGKVCEAVIDRAAVAEQHADVELENRCFELFSELTEAREKLQNVDARLSSCESERTMLKEDNATLASQIKYIEDLNVCRNCAPVLENSSQPLTDVGTRQRLRKIKELKTKAEKALWFLDSYGVTLDTLSVEDSNGQQVDLKVNPEGNGCRISKYEALPEKQKTTVKEVLHILDRFCVGDAAYHSLTVLESGLPRSYMVKQCRGDINGTFHITRTPGDLIVAQMSFEDELRRKIKQKVGIWTLRTTSIPS